MEMQKLPQEPTKIVFPKKVRLSFWKRLVVLNSKANWYTNSAIIILLIALCIELFSRPTPKNVSLALQVIAACIFLSSAFMGKSNLSENAGTEEQQKADGKLALMLTMIGVVFQLLAIATSK